MKAEDLKTKTPDELQKLLLEQRKEQFNMRFQKVNGSLENTAAFREARKTIARIKTFLNQQKQNETSAKTKKQASEKPAANKKTKKETKAA